MALEIHVFSNRTLSSMLAWQKAIDALGYELHLDDQRPIESLSGFLPAVMGQKITGFECDHRDAAEMVSTRHPGGESWRHALSFRFVGDIDEAIAAWMSASAYAAATNGVVFDDQDGRARDALQAAEIVRELESARPALEEAIRALTERIERS